MEKHFLLAADFSDFCDRLDGADLVICIHDRDQCGLIRDRCFNFLRADEAVFVDIEKCDLKAFFCQLIESMQYRMVLKLRRDDVILALCFSKKSHRTDRLVICFGSAGCKEDLSRLSTDHGGDRLSCELELFLRLLAESVKARRVAVCFIHQGDHLIDRSLTHFCCRCIICVDHIYSFLFTCGHSLRTRLSYCLHIIFPIHLPCQ